MGSKEMSKDVICDVDMEEWAGERTSWVPGIWKYLIQIQHNSFSITKCYNIKIQHSSFAESTGKYFPVLPSCRSSTENQLFQYWSPRMVNAEVVIENVSFVTLVRKYDEI